MKQALKKGKVGYLSFLLILLGALVLLDGVAVVFASGFHMGVLFTLILGAVLITVGYFYPRLHRAVCAVFCVCLALGILLVAFLPLYGARDTATYDEDVVIVLGAGLRGEEPSPGLRRRLDAAHAYAIENSEALIVVSGGQGEDELVAESAAMKRYLVEKGVDASRIIEENTSTSTAENFANTKMILDEMGVAYGRIAIATSDYHILRAVEVAKATGFGEVTVTSSATPFLYALPVWLREWAAVIYYAVFGIS